MTEFNWHQFEFKKNEPFDAFDKALKKEFLLKRVIRSIN